MSTQPPLSRSQNLIRLNKAIARLAVEHSIIVQQTVNDVLQRTNATRDPLVVMLRNAVLMSSSTGSGGGGDEARIPLNSSAFHSHAQLRSDIEMAWRALTPDMVSLPSGWETHDALRSWFDVFFPAAAKTGSPITDEVVEHAANIFDGWMHTIEGMFNPPLKVTNWKPCPRCGNDRALIADESVPAIMMSIDPLGTPHALCRGCNHRWDGTADVTQLAKDQRDIASLVVDVETPLTADPVPETTGPVTL